MKGEIINTEMARAHYGSSIVSVKKRRRKDEGKTKDGRTMSEGWTQARRRHDAGRL